MKCLNMKLPNHFSVYVTNEKWPKDCCNKWDSHFYKICLNTLTWKQIYYKEAKDVITTCIASQLASMIYQDKNTAWVEIKCLKLKMRLPNPLRMNLQMSQSKYSEWVPTCRAELVISTSRKINLVLWMK